MLLPGLAGPVSPLGSSRPGDALSLVCEDLPLAPLERFLCRAQVIPLDWRDESLEGLICQCFDMTRPVSGDWPIAAIERSVHQTVDSQTYFLRADPVHLQAGMRDITLFDARMLSLGHQQAGQFCHEINHHFQSQRWRLTPVTPEFWCLDGLRDADVQTQPLSLLHGTTLEGNLPTGGDAGPWRQWLNEVQMLLHNSDINSQRQADGQLPVNGVWLWGGGRIPLLGKAPWQSVHGGDPLSHALASLSHTRYFELAEDGTTTLAQIDEHGEHLLVLTDLYESSRIGQVEQWRASLDGIAQQWLAPLMNALISGDLASLSIAPGDGRVFRANRWQTGRWWRRTRRFAAIMTGQR